MADEGMGKGGDVDVEERPVETPAPGANLADLAGRDDRTVMSNMADLVRAKGAATDRVLTTSEREMDADRAAMKRAFNASGLEVEKLKPWNASEEHKKFETSPLEAFGSFASVFGIVASAFTHAPLENALNASASAMNAIREGDEEKYKRAEGAHKEAMDLVVKRHTMQREAFSDANTLMKTDMAAGLAKAQNIAQRFGDKQSAMLLDAGLSKEFFELQDARNKAILGAADASEKMTVSALRKEAMATDEVINDPNATPMMKLYRIQTIMGAKQNTAEAAAIHREFETNPNVTPERLAEIKESFQRAQRVTTDDRIMEALDLDHEAQGKPKPTAAEYGDAIRRAKAAGGAGAGGNQNLTVDRQIAAGAAELRKELEAQGLPRKEIDTQVDAYVKERKTASSAPSGNKADELKGKSNQVKYSLETIDKVEKLLKDHKFITGFGGSISRAAELAGNIAFGSNQTDYKQFERYIAELQEWAPRVLTGTAGRPLSAEAEKVKTIIAGLRAGDTVANTVRAYKELKPLLKEIQKDLDARASGAPVTAPAKEEVVPPPAKRPWEQDRSPGKRSDAGEDAAYG